MNNEDLLTELRWALDNIGASRDYFRIGNALESAIKALSPSATSVDHGYDRTASLNAGHYVCTCGGGNAMTSEDKEKIEALAVKHLAAQETFHRLGMQNIYGKTADEAEQQAKEYAVAIADMQQAAADLRAAQKPK